VDAPPPEKFELNTTVQIDDFVDMNVVVLGRTLLVMRVIGLLTVALSPISYFLGTPIEFAIWPAVFGVTLLVLTSRPFLRWQLMRKARGVIGTPISAVIDDEAIDVASAGMTARLPWSAVTRGRHNDRSVVLMRDRVIYGWFPIRELDDSTRQRLMSLISRHVPDFEKV